MVGKDCEISELELVADKASALGLTGRFNWGWGRSRSVLSHLNGRYFQQTGWLPTRLGIAVFWCERRRKLARRWPHERGGHGGQFMAKSLILAVILTTTPNKHPALSSSTGLVHDAGLTIFPCFAKFGRLMLHSGHGFATSSSMMALLS